MPVPETYAGKVTKANFEAVAVETNLKVSTAAAPELIRDTIATALVAGTNVTITPNDPGDTITIAYSGSATLGKVWSGSAYVDGTIVTYLGPTDPATLGVTGNYVWFQTP